MITDVFVFILLTPQDVEIISTIGRYDGCLCPPGCDVVIMAGLGLTTGFAGHEILFEAPATASITFPDKIVQLCDSADNELGHATGLYY